MTLITPLELPKMSCTGDLNFFQNKYWKPLIGPNCEYWPLEETRPLDIIMREADILLCFWCLFAKVVAYAFSMVSFIIAIKAGILQHQFEAGARKIPWNLGSF